MNYTSPSGYFLYPDGESFYGVNVVRHGVAGLEIKRKTHEVLKRFNAPVQFHATLVNGEAEGTVCFNMVAAKVYAKVNAALEARAAAKAKAASDAEKALPKPKVEKKK